MTVILSRLDCVSLSPTDAEKWHLCFFFAGAAHPCVDFNGWIDLEACPHNACKYLNTGSVSQYILFYGIIVGYLNAL